MSGSRHESMSSPKIPSPLNTKPSPSTDAGFRRYASRAESRAASNAAQVTGFVDEAALRHPWLVSSGSFVHMASPSFQANLHATHRGISRSSAGIPSRLNAGRGGRRSGSEYRASLRVITPPCRKSTTS